MEEREDGKTGPKGFTQTLNFIPFFAQHPKCCRHWRSKKQLENDQNPIEIQVSRALPDPLVIPNLIRESQIYSLPFSTWSFLIHFSSWKSEGWSQPAMRRHQIREEKSYLDDKKLPKSWFDTGRELYYWGFFLACVFQIPGWDFSDGIRERCGEHKAVGFAPMSHCTDGILNRISSKNATTSLAKLTNLQALRTLQ